MNKKDKIKVLHITTRFPYTSEEKETIAPWLWTLLEKTNEYNIDTTILAASNKARKTNQLLGLKVYHFRYAPGFLEGIGYDMAIIEKLKKNPFYYLVIPFYIIGGFLKAVNLSFQKFDLVHIHWPVPCAFFSIPFKLKGIPVIHSYYSSELKILENSKLIKLFFYKLLKSADKHISISNYTEKLSKKILGSNISTCILPVPSVFLLDFDKMKKSKETISGPSILYVGRLVERKGIKFLMMAVNNLKKKYNNIKLNIVGSGPLLNNLQSLRTELNLKDEVIFHKNIPIGRLKELYEKAEIFVLPAIHDSKGDTEGLGMVLVEALQYGVPVIASGIGGITDIISDNKTGLLVNEKNPEDICRKIEYLICNTEKIKELVVNGQKHVSENFSVENISKKLSYIYNNVLNKNE